MSDFRLVGLEPAQFVPLFELGDAELSAQGMRRVRADSPTGFPCRISLRDAAVGEELLLLPFLHQRVDSPYRALGPIYVRRGAARARLPAGFVPEYVSSRLISLRAYDGADMMVAAEVRPGTEVSEQIAEMFADPAVAYIHLHNARRGCFSCRAERVQAA